MLFKLIVIFLFVCIFFNLGKFLKLRRGGKLFNAKKLTAFNKNNLNNWMNLTKKERYNLLKQESLTYLDKRKILLEEIRKEYKKISKGNSDLNTK